MKKTSATIRSLSDGAALFMLMVALFMGGDELYV